MRTQTFTTTSDSETKILEPVADAMVLDEPIFETLAPEPTPTTDDIMVRVVEPTLPEFDAELALIPGGEPLQAIGVAGLLAFVEKAQEFYEKGKSVWDFFDNLLSGPDKPENSEQITDALNELQADMEEIKGEIDGILDAIYGLGSQINTNLIAEVTVQAFNLFDSIAQFDDPTSEQLDEIAADGAELWNTVAVDLPNALENAPIELISGQLAPAVILATSARIASAVYGSDEGLGSAAVQSDINAAKNMLNEIFSANGQLAQLLEDEVDHETYMVSGFNGDGVYEFLIVHTLTGPTGESVQLVIGDHTYSPGQPVGDVYPPHYSRSGSINGVSAHTDPEGAAAELSGLGIDHVVAFDPQHEEQLDQAWNWYQSQEAAAVGEIVEAELGALGGDAALAFIESLPSTAGLNEGDHGGSGGDHIVGFEGGEGFILPSPDLLMGGGGDDLLEGLGERDALFGESGYDTLLGGDGNDKLFGGNHDDSLEGGDGHDKLQGEHGRDTLKGGDGADVLFQSERGDFFSFQDPDNFNQSADYGGRLEGGKGDDLMVGDHGDDDIIGGLGNDVAYGYGGADDIDGGAGNDEIYAGAGNDEVAGGEGEDTIEGGAGNDTIDGGWSDDTIVGGAGDDDITGGWGADTVIFHGSFHGSVSSGGIDDYAFAGDHPESDFTVVQAASGDWTVTDIRDDPTDGVDIIRSHPTLAQSGGYGVEFLKFDNVVIELDPVVADPGYAVKEKGATVNPDFVGANDLTDDPYDPAWAQIGEAPLITVKFECFGDDVDMLI